MENPQPLTDSWKIGFLRSGNEILEKHCVSMPSSLVGNRLAVFAQSGFGKTNAVKVLLWGAIDQNYGKLIFDRRGEYVPDTTNEYGEKVPGLANHHHAKERLVLYSSKKSILNNQELKAKIYVLTKFGIDITVVPPSDLVRLYPNITNPQKEFLYIFEGDLNIYKSILSANEQGYWDESNWGKTLSDWFGNKEAKEKLDLPAATVVRSIRKKLTNLQKRPFIAPNQNTIKEIFEHLRNGRTVVIDLSGYISELDRTFIVTLISRKLFEYNLERLDISDTGGGKIKAVIAFEEAQTLLSSEQLIEGSVFVDLAKEGRALEIGLLAITQQPSAISTKILSQFNSFLALHLEFDEDIKFLSKVAGNFEGLELDLRRKVPGNAYLVTRIKPFAIPLRAFHFNHQFIENHKCQG